MRPYLARRTRLMRKRPAGSLPDSPSQSSTRPATDDSRSPAAREVTWASLPRTSSTIKKTSGPSRATGQRTPLAPPYWPLPGRQRDSSSPIRMSCLIFVIMRRNLDHLNDTFDTTITTAEVIAIPATLMITGYMRHDSYQVSTALLAAEAYANSAVVDLAVKAITRRKRPSDVPPGAPFSNTFFNGGKSPFKGSSFPSGHAAGAFSVAT